MNPIEHACAQLLDRQAKRNTLHLRFGSAMRANAVPAPRWSAEPEPVSRLRPGGRPSLSRERGR